MATAVKWILNQRNAMKNIPLCLAGFGNVGQAFARLLLKKAETLKKELGREFVISAIATRRHGYALDPGGLDVTKAIEIIRQKKSLKELNNPSGDLTMDEIIRQSRAEVLLENTPVNYANGQPALEHITTALQQDLHAITANKGAVLHGYEKLNRMASTKGKRFLFESTVMDGAPIFSLFREVLPAIQLNGFEGILNSCTNLILERMGAGEDFDHAVEYAKSIGIAETEPSGDIDGWDAAIKTTLLVNLLMKSPMQLNEVERHGIREINANDLHEARQSGEKWKLICRGERIGGRVKTSVMPEKVGAQSPFFNVTGTSSFVLFKTDELPGLGILESNPGPETTAYGLLSDLLSIYKD
jgi:homoserine dehydrogenase